MLEPNDRAGLYEALRPPTGFVLDHAVGTSFTLDLEALLTAPIAFALYAAAEADAQGELEPVGLLEAVRRHSERITLFCQAGHVAVPATHRTVFAWLEDALVTVRPPKAGFLFHPKVWIVRYATPDGSRAVLRVLCATRNLTFDTSWDSLLRVETDPYPVADGPPSTGEGPLRPLADLVRALPSMSTEAEQLPDAPATALARIARELDTAHVTAPEPFRSLSFDVHGLGGPTRSPIPDGATRAAVVSPFVDPRFLADLTAAVAVDTLVSKDATLHGLEPALLAPVGRVAVLNPAAEVDPTDEPDTGAAPRHGGLHAKLFVSDVGDVGVVVTGSANATRAAFRGNVEVTATLLGPVEQVGVDALVAVGEKGERGFGSLLVDFDPLDEVAHDPADELARDLDRIRRELAVGSLSATVQQRGDRFDLVVSGESVTTSDAGLDELHLTLRPVTLDRASAVALASGVAVGATFSVSLEGITAFFVFEVSGRRDGIRHTTATLVKATLDGAPPDRRSRLLAAMLRDPDRLLRYLVLLLTDLDGDEGEGGAGAGAWMRRLARGGHDDLPLVELLVRAVERSPERLDHIDDLVAELGAQRSEVLPPGFDELWDAVWTVRQDASR